MEASNHVKLTLFHSYNWWTLIIMAAMRLDSPVYKYTGPTFCHVTQAVAIAGVASNFWAGAGITKNHANSADMFDF